MAGTDAVWESFAERLRGFFRKRVADANVVDDLLQETFLRIHRGVAALRDETRQTGWVFQVARNVLRDHFVRRNRRDPLPAPVEEDAELRREVAKWLPDFVDELPEHYRVPLAMADLREMKQAEVAERLGLSLTAVKSRVRRGRALLAERLRECCRFELDRRRNVIGVEPGGPCGCSDSEACS